jgi:hypothetical protein
MIGQLEDLFIKVWRGASILSVFFVVYFSVLLTKEIDSGVVRLAIVLGAVVAAAIFAGGTAWAMRLMDVSRDANLLAKKQLKVSVQINQQLLKLMAERNKEKG